MSGLGPGRNPFQILGVDLFADEEQIKQAYRKKATLLHPDKNKDNTQYENSFKELKNAYETILKLQKKGARLQHDGLKDGGLYKQHTQGGIGARLVGIFSGGTNFAGPFPATGSDLAYTVHISFMESLHGKRLSFPVGPM